MGSIRSVAARGCSTGKVESPVDNDTTGLESNELPKQLQTTVPHEFEQLQKQLELARKQKEELQEELAAIDRENHYLKNGVTMQKVISELRQAQFEVEGLRQENQKLQKQLSLVTQPQIPSLPDLEELRDRIVGNWKVAKRSESKERIKQAIDRFIEQLHTWLHNTQQPSQPSMQPLNSSMQPSMQPSWESRAESFLSEVSWNG